MKYTDDNITNNSHELGHDANLQRYCHDDFLTNIGISNYQQYTQSQLQSILVGKTGTTTSFMSTSYDVNKNPFATGANSGGREVVLDIKAAKTTRCVLGAKRESEIILNKNTNFKIADVSYTGQTASPRGGSLKKQVKITIEVW